MAGTQFLSGEEQVRFGIPIGPRGSSRGPYFNCAESGAGALRGALEREIRRSVGLSGTFVEFSGGCDSSLVLSAATRVCRELGADDPIPLTYRFAGAPASEEVEFQEFIVRFLKLRAWEIIDYPSGSGDCLGSAAAESLSTTGLIWPATLHFRAPVYERIQGGVLLTGEGGDEALGVRRLSWLAEAGRYLLRGKRVPPRRVIRSAALSVAPTTVRRQALIGELDSGYRPAWLGPLLRRDLVSRTAALQCEEPLRPTRWPSHHWSLPHVWLGINNARHFAVRLGVRWEAPLLSHEFLGAVSKNVPWWEYRGREILLRHYFADLLPQEILERKSKGTFNEAYFGASTRAFAERWDGYGLPTGVDAHWLREHWRSAESIHAGTAMLLHHAWLTAEGLSTTPAGQPAVAASTDSYSPRGKQ